jgi:pimeloyl-ACP methyl ester carboxylesterase
MSSRRHEFLLVNDIRLHAVIEGDGPLVVLLHGWPESWYSWRHQLTAIAQAGYRVVAFDQRGYGQSSKFWNPEAFRIDKLVADVCAVIRFFGEKTAVVVGHDWGAAVAWTAAWLHPELVRGVVGLSVPFADRALCPLPGNPFGEVRPKLIYGGLAGPGQTFYQDYFGRMDAIVTEFESDVRGWLLGATWSFSGDALSQLGINMDQIDPVELLRGTPL